MTSRYLLGVSNVKQYSNQYKTSFYLTQKNCQEVKEKYKNPIPKPIKLKNKVMTNNFDNPKNKEQIIQQAKNHLLTLISLNVRSI